jgi:hypothetical protein
MTYTELILVLAQEVDLNGDREVTREQLDEILEENDVFKDGQTDENPVTPG